MKPVVFWGATGQALVLRDALVNSEWRLDALFDNRRIISPFPDVPIYCSKDEFLLWHMSRKDIDLYACVAIGGGRGRERLELLNWLESEGCLPLTVIHPRSFLASDVSVGRGCQILAMAAVCASVKLEDAVIINTAASVDHGSFVGSASHIGPKATLCGEVLIGENVFVGASATILPRVHVGDNAIVGAGSIVTKDVPANTIVVGNPARPYYRLNK